MTGVRDPQFWKRFSVAVHQDDEEWLAADGKRELKESDQWLIRTQKKKRGNYALVCIIFWLLLSAIVAGVVITIVVLIHNGTFARIHIGTN
ncbi:hypothetical protein AAFC00_006171 [Neodothiora populina]|uniref:Uncharacterized protein n=1 Tax=Neodothiora populina TaxID=2781224 RepID=A0ABR3P4F5_9PEZI